MRKSAMICIFLFALLSACGSPAETPTPPPFSPPTIAITPTPQASPIPSRPAPSPTPDCAANLTFLADLTVPDGTVVQPGTAIDKRWQVLNSGSCNWDKNYSILLIAGTDMGSASPQALYPALAGTEATVQIRFSAPGQSGIYRSAWQASGPDGQVFGDPIFIEVVVP